jgi:hypothetical protein
LLHIAGRNTTVLITSHVFPTRFATAVALVLLAAACSGQETTTNGSTPGPTVTATTASTTSAGPMTGAELVWLEGVGALHKTMDDVLQDSPSTLTSKAMHSLADQFAACTVALDKLGSPTDRLRPVHELARQGCTQYEKAGKCFATAASLGVVVKGSAEDKKQTDAIGCGFSAPGDGSKLFADAEGKGFELKDAAH